MEPKTLMLVRKLLNEYRDYLIDIRKDFPPIQETKYNASLVKRQKIKSDSIQKSVKEIDEILKQTNDKK